MMITRLMAIPTSIALTGTVLATPSLAQTAGPCADRDAVVSHLVTQYGEIRQSVALGSNNTLVETFASLETGTWTIIVTTPGGPSCLVASGQAFQLEEQNLASLDPET